MKKTSAILKRAWLGLVLLLAMALGLTGCNSDTSGGSEADSQVVIGLTDAEGDFASYTVDVKSLTLTRASGEVVQALPLTTRVDFAQYTDMTEFLTAASVSSGHYVQAKMVLDYSNADIQVEDANGDAQKVTSIVDADGNPVSQLEVSVQLEGRNALTILPGVPAHLTLDFDLQASNAWDSATSTLTVQPLLLADLEVAKFKTHRLRGPLESVDVAASTFDVIIRPFAYALSGPQHQFGDMTVTTTSSTVFDIDGSAYQGDAGLQALAAKDPLTALVVMGNVKLNPPRFEATEVHAGASVPGGSNDVVSGNVIARSGDTLTVKGATLVRAGGSAIFNDEVTVQLGGLSQVRRQLSADTGYGINDVSVGQRVTIFGTLTADSATQLEMDAGLTSAGGVIMQLTTLRGTVANNTTGDFAIDLQSIDGRRVALFDFTGSGDVAGNDADPTYYEIDNGTLDVSGLAVDTPVKVRGFVRPFGQAPKDFEAQSISNVSAMPGVMAVSWNPASAAALANISASGLDLDLAGVGVFHHVARGWVATDLVSLAQANALTIQLQPSNGSNGLFWIGQGGTRQLYLGFSAFANALTTRLTEGAMVKAVAATGLFDDTSGVMSSNQVRVELE